MSDILRKLSRLTPSARVNHGCLVVEFTVPLPGDCQWAHFNTAKAEFKAAWKALKARTTPEDLAAAFKVMNIRGGG